jgi:hypothetical protein
MILTTRAARGGDSDWGRPPARNFLHPQGRTDQNQAGKREFPQRRIGNDDDEGQTKVAQAKGICSFSATRMNSTRFHSDVTHFASTDSDDKLRQGNNPAQMAILEDNNPA